MPYQKLRFFHKRNNHQKALSIRANSLRYRKHKPVADKLEAVVFKEKFRREHESELIIFTAAEKYPLIKELRAEQKKLYAEKDRLYSSYNAAKTEIKELDTVMKNVDMILGKDKEKDRQRDIQRKRSGELE